MNQQWYQDTYYDEERTYDIAADYYYYENDADDDFGALHPWSTPVENQYSRYMFWREFNLITEQCALPAVLTAYWWSSHVGVTLVASICFRILILFFQRFRCLSNWVLHIVCAACGLAPALISSSTKENGIPHHRWVPAALIVGYMVLLYSISLLTILLERNNTNKKQEKFNAAVVFSAVVLALLVYREYVLDSSRAWQSTRGTHMLMSMKAVALILDYRSGRLNSLPSIAEYTGYMLCAGCAQLGPYISYKQYLQAFRSRPSTYLKNLKQWVAVIKNLGLSMAWFMGSVCYVDWLLDTSYYRYYGIAIAVDTYRRAASYRSGHYFIAAVGTTNAQACGYLSECDERIVTAKPSSVEWPKQMSYVASAWDIPTHQWLKTSTYRTFNAQTAQ
ncbi:protein-serine O-palmitoleoyltransferase porcupine isoform X2 [Adelges cooleyi]|uniref:protein-serine O-palmitoleoyltransferase porcupine isoform X2 n=1 Tax=Adelges cooleyi TaxID=133065 RepID=UPI00217F3812|nr:protein-serine O-palmitoleoyltransferase porcupine isoform X2 [Adelges cooleyi]